MDLSALRQEYADKGLSESDLPDAPQTLFHDWMATAQQHELLEPNAMILATVDRTGQPYNRTVLLKYLDADGFVFFTNYDSRKADHLEENAHVSLLFLWLPLQRQVMVNGLAERTSRKESLEYFLKRPLASQLGAWASPQSRIIRNRSLLEAKFQEVKRKFSAGQVPLPGNWGGYRVRPHTIEFWQGRSSRLHDRFLYSQDDNGKWSVERLAP